jgi:uncharacterized protein YcnI
MCKKILLVAAAVAAVVIASASPAAAHVTIDGEGSAGGFATFSFNVPNERPEAGTVELRVQVLADLPFVSTQPKPGWTTEVTMRTLDEPIDAFGEEVTEVVDTITWSGGRIGPGEFDQFGVSVGPLPDEEGSLLFPTTQVYEGGEEVAWEEADPEAERPAPSLTIGPAEEGGHSEGEEDEEMTTTSAADEGDETAAPPASESDDDGTDGVAVAALIVGALGLVAGLAGITMARRGSG